MEKSKLRIHVCEQYASLRILEELLWCKRGVEVYCMFDELWRFIALRKEENWQINIPKLLQICWWKTWKAHNI